MSDAPNARAIHKEGDTETVTYSRLEGSKLTIRWAARQTKGWIEFSSSDVVIALNDVKLPLVQSLKLAIDPLGFPVATINFQLTELDIDVDTLLHLEAFVKQQKLGVVQEEGN